MGGTLWNLDSREGLLRNAVRELALLKTLAAGCRNAESVGGLNQVTSDEFEAYVPRVKLAFIGQTPASVCNRSLFIVTETFEHTLTSFMETKQNMDVSILQSYSRQLVAGVGFLHSRGIVHRLLCRSCMKVDLQGNLRIGGLHSACVPYPGVRPACTAPWEYAGHYKAPELMLGIGEFSPPCDMWSVGAIVACMCKYMEIVQELWPNADQSEIALLFGIFKRLGTPRPPHALTFLPNFSDQFPVWRPTGWSEVESSIGRAGSHLLDGLTNLDPESRLTAQEALCHEFFRRAAGPDVVEEFADDVIQAYCPHGRDDWCQNDIPAGIEELEPERCTTEVQVLDSPAEVADAAPATDPWHRFQWSAAQQFLAPEVARKLEEKARYFAASVAISIALRRRGSRNMLVKSNILSFLRVQDGVPSEDLFAVQTDINAAMRAILVDWLVDVCCKYGHDFGTLCLAVSIIDQHIAQKAVCRKHLQLLGVAAFLLATKVAGDSENGMRVNLHDMAYITASAYTKKQVQDMEEELLPYIGTSVCCWGPYHFLHHFIVMLQLPPRYADLARLCLMQGLLQADLSAYTDLLRAASACTIALKFAYDRKEMPGTFLQSMRVLSSLSCKDQALLKKCAERVWVAVHVSPNLKAIKKRFADAWKLVSTEKPPVDAAA